MSSKEITEPDLGYADIMERVMKGEEQRQRERMLMEEGTQLWRAKKKEEYEQAMQDQMDVSNLEKMLCSWCNYITAFELAGTHVTADYEHGGEI